MSDRPPVSLVLLAYNQERFIREAVEGAFCQTYSPLEIVLSDDASSDRTFDIIREMAAGYAGPHKVILNRNEKNLGIGMHFNKVVELATGQIIELAAGDDISLPWRTAASVRVLMEHPELSCISLEFMRFNEKPDLSLLRPKDPSTLTVYSLNDWLNHPHIHVNAAARAFWRNTHVFFGPLNDDCPNEDAPNLFRCLLHGSAGACDTLGVLYRWHGLNASEPDRIWRLPFPLVHRVYFAALAKAFDGELIDERERVRIECILKRKCKRSLVLQEAYLSKSWFVAARLILFSDTLSVRDKLEHCGRRIKSVIKDLV